MLANRGQMISSQLAPKDAAEPAELCGMSEILLDSDCQVLFSQVAAVKVALNSIRNRGTIAESIHNAPVRYDGSKPCRRSMFRQKSRGTVHWG